MKNKTIIPFNYKVLFILIADFIFLIGSIILCIKHIYKENWLIVLGCLVCILFFILGFLVFFLKNIKFRESFILIPKEYGDTGKPQTGNKLLYKDIYSVRLVKKNEAGPHVKSLNKDLDTIVFTTKSDNEYLLSVQFCSNKQINSILSETKKRSKL